MDARSVIDAMVSACKQNAGDIDLTTALQCAGVVDDPGIAVQDADMLQQTACQAVAPYCAGGRYQQRARQAAAQIGCDAQSAPACGVAEAHFDRCDAQARIENLQIDDKGVFALDVKWRDGTLLRWGFQGQFTESAVSREDFQLAQQRWMHASAGKSWRDGYRDLLARYVDLNCQALHSVAEEPAAHTVAWWIFMTLTCGSDTRCQSDVRSKAGLRACVYRPRAPSESEAERIRGVRVCQDN